MERRKFLAGLGGTAIGASALVGSGAFSVVNAERSASITTSSDSEALLTLEANPDYGGDQEDYVSESEIGTIELNLDDVNRNAVTLFEDLVRVTNEGTQDIVVFVNNDFGEPGVDPIWGSGYGSDGPMDILNGGGSIVGGNPFQTDGDNPELGPGESANLSVEVDTRGFGDDSWPDGEILIIGTNPETWEEYYEDEYE